MGNYHDKIVNVTSLYLVTSILLNMLRSLILENYVRVQIETRGIPFRAEVGNFWQILKLEKYVNTFMLFKYYL